MNAYTPKSVAQYLDMLKDALKGADASLIQDALYDAEEYLRAELAANPGMSEADLLAQVAGSYGAPEEVADIYRDTEVTVQKALHSPGPRRPAAASALAAKASVRPGFFGVVLDPHTYGALFYMLLSLATGVFYFTWATTGLSLSAGLMILIIGIPFFILFMASVYVISLVEGRLVETLLGVRMPRRPVYRAAGEGWLARVKSLFADPRTWLSLMYMVLMLPLGIVYFTLSVTLLALSLSLTAAPLLWWLIQMDWVSFYGDAQIQMGGLNPAVASPLLFIGGVLLLFVSLHVIRFIGQWHGRFAKHVLVESGTD
jgi:uncharacterized membrane protein